MNNIFTKIGLGVLALAIAFASGRYFAPVKIQEKQVVKEVVRTEKEYVTREIKKPDGTVIKEVIVTDTVKTAKEKTKEKIVTNEKPNYKASIIPKYSFKDYKISYGASVEKRLMGPVFGGVYADTDKNLGVVISLEF